MKKCKMYLSVFWERHCGEETTREVVHHRGHLISVYICTKGHRMPTWWRV